MVADLRLAFLAEERGEPAVTADKLLRAGVLAWLASTDDGRSVTWLAENDAGQAVGVVTLILDSRPPRPGDLRTTVGYVVHLYVAPSERHRGVGRALFDALVAGARQRGCRQLFLHATDDGLAMYLASGFTPNERFLDLELP